MYLKKCELDAKRYERWSEFEKQDKLFKEKVEMASQKDMVDFDIDNWFFSYDSLVGEDPDLADSSTTSGENDSSTSFESSEQTEEGETSVAEEKEMEERVEEGMPAEMPVSRVAAATQTPSAPDGLGTMRSGKVYGGSVEVPSKIAPSSGRISSQAKLKEVLRTSMQEKLGWDERDIKRAFEKLDKKSRRKLVSTVAPSPEELLPRRARRLAKAEARHSTTKAAIEKVAPEVEEGSMKPMVSKAPSYEPSYSLSDRLHGYADVKTESTEKGASSCKSEPIRSQNYISRVELPSFTGKEDFNTWWSMFQVLVDQGDEPVPIKFLRLRGVLKGEPAELIEHLPHDELSYELAKEKITDTYGGEQRRIYRLYNEAAAFKAITDPEDLNAFKTLSCLMLQIVRCLCSTTQKHELENGALCFICTSKAPKEVILKFHEWREKKAEEHTLLSFSTYIEEYIARQVTALETVYDPSKVKRFQKKGGSSGGSRSHHGSGNAGHEPSPGTKPSLPRSGKGKADGKGKCLHCKGGHMIYLCPLFKELSIDMRRQKAREYNLCYRCLSGVHIVAECRSDRTCGVNGCTANHHRLLHDEAKFKKYVAQRSANRSHKLEKKEKQAPSEDKTLDLAEDILSEEPENPEKRSNLNIDLEVYAKRYIALRTVPVIIEHRKQRLKVNALLDDGSSTTFLNASVAEELQITGEALSSYIKVLNDQTVEMETQVVELTIESIDGRTRMTDYAEIAKKALGNMKPIDWQITKANWPHLAEVDFPPLPNRGSVDVLIGCNFSDLMGSRGEVFGQQGEPTARLTPLGWTCIGPVESVQPKRSHLIVQQKRTRPDRELDENLKRYWYWEDGPKEAGMSAEDRQAERYVEETIRYDTEKQRYTVKIPYKSGKTPIVPDNYSQAYRRLVQTERRLMKYPEQAIMYKGVFTRYIEIVYLRLVDLSKEDLKIGKKFYLSHFPIIKPGSVSTKCRPVYDGGSEFEGISINMLECTGPKYQQDIVIVILRFRRFPKVVGCDISEMYLQIFVDEEEQDYQRVLWRDLDSSKPPQIYAFTRVMFGRRSSPYLALKVSRVNADKFEAEFPEAADTVRNSTYMDDLMDSRFTEAEIFTLKEQLDALWKRAGMTPKKWFTNCPELLDQIPEEDREPRMDILLNLEPKAKTLGMLWLALLDCFSYEVKVKVLQAWRSKRCFLQLIASVFDPLGFILPFIIRGRSYLQQLWAAGYDWDDVLEGDMVDRIQGWVEELEELKKIQIPRVIFLCKEIDASFLHAFSDASIAAYGAVLYAVVFYTSGLCRVSFICSKGRIAPIQSVSVPRLELQGGVVAVEMVERVAETLLSSVREVYFWSDSMDILYWIHSQSRGYGPFVGNRVAMIQKATDPVQWRYVSTAENPADILTRGLGAGELRESSLWFDGPGFIKLPKEQWPETKLIRRESDPERRKSALQFAMLTVHEKLIVAENYSSWLKAKRITAWIFRFILNARIEEMDRQTGYLNVDELGDAALYLIREAQVKEWKAEIQLLKKGQEVQGKSRIKKCLPWLDENGVLRARTRLQESSFLAWDTKNPVLLPPYAHVTTLIIREIHKNLLHAGTAVVMNNMRLQYYILADRERIKQVLRSCTVCAKEAAKPYLQQMANLPASRMEPRTRAFHMTSVDLAGPFLTKAGRGRARNKRWLAVFSCTATRAVHLEIVYDLSTDEFMQTVVRFSSKKAVPAVLQSDNGTNFVGAWNEFKHFIGLLKTECLAHKLAAQRIQWKFLPPLSPHHGGIHESMVKLAKRAILKVLGNAVVSDGELTTVFAKTEAYMNQRPMTYSGDQLEEPPVLTPADFIVGQASLDIVPQAVEENPSSYRTRWQLVEVLTQHVWDRWMSEWVASLGPRAKWIKKFKNVQQGDIVIVPDQSLMKGHWPLGRIQRTYQGKDGLVRVVDVLVGGRILKRPIVKLSPLFRE